MPGGNTRSAIFVDPFPVTMARGEGSHLWDVDGHEYGRFPQRVHRGIFGHSHPAIRKAIDAALDGGLNFGAHGAAEARFAAAICDRFPSIDLVRFTTAGTEANLMGGSGRCGARPDKRNKIPGLLRRLSRRRFLLPWQRQRHQRTVRLPDGGVQRHRGDPCGGGAAQGRPSGDLARADARWQRLYSSRARIPLADLRALASETGAVLIFDEVMTSRLAPGGLQEVHGINPDMTTLGKYVGGGMSFGAFGGKTEIMEWFDPRRQDGFQHAGTFNNNVLTMNAGYAGLTEIYLHPGTRSDL